MLNNSATLNAKGHVKLELYNDNGVFYTKEKKNLVVQSANKIVANMMADPARVIRVHQVDRGDSALSANEDSLYPFDLTVQHKKKGKFENNWGSANTQDEFVIEDLKGITTIDKVTVGENELVIDEDIFLLDAEIGKIKFKNAPTDNVVIHYHKIANPYMKIVEGTEKVFVDGEKYERSTTASIVGKTYKMNYETGQVLFSGPVKNIRVEYDYHMNYCLGFMALGGKPKGVKDYQPVDFGHSNKLDTFMENELPGSRMPILYPASITREAKEIDPAIPTQPVATVKKEAEIEIVEDVAQQGKALLKYELPNTHYSQTGTSTHPVYQIVSAQNETKQADITENVSLPMNKWNLVEIEFNENDVEIGDKVKVEYELILHNKHLTYELSQAPVIELISVAHIDSLTQERKDYLVVDGGLRPNQGDVWISDPNRGLITFMSGNPRGKDPFNKPPRPEAPGQIQVEYRINAGVIVRFVADFPKGVPLPKLEDITKTFEIASGQTSLQLDYPIAKDENEQFIKPTITVISEGSSTVLSESEYNILSDGKTIVPNILQAGDEVVVEYKFEKSTHDIYQVAMFDEKDGGTMFNISGIGPVTKDKNTGMRVTWSVTF